MGLTAIEHQIQADAEREAQSIAIKADERIAELQASAKLALSESAAVWAAKQEKATAEASKRQQSRLQQIEKHATLAAKQAVVAQVLDAFYAHMVGLDDAAYTAFITKRLADPSIQKGTFLVSEKHERLMEPLVPKGSLITVVKSLQGGFIYKGEGVEIDQSLRTLVYDTWREALTMQIASNF
ncbi:hypothetical protein H6771_02205 [Candidatus Peribacteria bacterium]|nr:hypothetical protein [Candidatus Peribacteria bacterium]